MSRDTTLTDCGISTSGMSDLEALVPSFETYRSATTTTGPMSWTSSCEACSWATPGPANEAPIIKPKACLAFMANTPFVFSLFPTAPRAFAAGTQTVAFRPCHGRGP
jgi:hypothetical protein